MSEISYEDVKVKLEQLDKQIIQTQEKIEGYEGELIDLVGENPYKMYSQEYYDHLWKTDESRDLCSTIENLREELRELRWERSSVGYPKHPHDILKGIANKLDEAIDQMMNLRGKIKGVMNEFR